MTNLRLIALVAPLLIAASATNSCESTPVSKSQNKEIIGHAVSGNLVVEDVIHNGKRYVVFTKHGNYDPSIFVIEDKDYKEEAAE